MSLLSVWGALIVAALAARVALRSRAVFLLGRRGHLTAPAVLASFWVAGLLLGQLTRSIAGMAWTAGAVLVVLALLARAWFRPARAHHAIWTPIDLAIVVGLAVLFWFTDRWDIECHRTIVGQFLHGNLPPTALNDPRAPLAYHAVYDALVAVVLTALPLQIEQGMALVSAGCVALTVTNLRAVSRVLFRSPVAGQLGRALFMFGFGPVFIRCFTEGMTTDAIHGRTSQAYADAILRRPAGLGFAFYTLALALALPAYRANSGVVTSDAAARRNWTALAFLLPTCALLPRMAEESMLFIGVLLLPLVVARRLPWRLVGGLVFAALIGAAGSGVVQGVLGQGTMATPHLGFSWPPRLPQWKFDADGVPVWSRQGFLFAALELGPAFVAALVVALATKKPRRRVLAGLFLAGLAVAAFVRPSGWPKADMDRFLFYGTPPIFMLVALLIDGAARSWRQGARVALALVTGLAVAGTPVMYPLAVTAEALRQSFTEHAFGGALKRDLDAIGPREPTVTTVGRANDLLEAGFLVIAPLDTNSVGRITEAHFDEYVRAHAQQAVWLYLPENDPRVTGKPIVARHDDYVLVRATPEAAPAPVYRSER